MAVRCIRDILMPCCAAGTSTLSQQTIPEKARLVAKLKATRESNAFIAVVKNLPYCRREESARLIRQ
jgi:hypothetical protein